MKYMPWCPKCGYKYRPDVKTCTDCGSELVEQNPNPPANTTQETRFILELALLCVLGPWVWLLSTSALGYSAHNVAVASETAAIITGCLAFTLPLVIVFSGAFLYGRFRSRRIGLRSGIASIAAGTVIQILLCLSFVVAGVVPEPWKLVFCFPAGVVLSVIIVVTVQLGFFLRSGNRV
jgi:hypothetical protein